MNVDFNTVSGVSLRGKNFICIIGTESMQNCLLTDYIKNDGGFSCEFKEDLSPHFFSDKSFAENYKELYLLDYEFLVRRINANFSMLFKEKDKNVKLGVFNVPPEFPILSQLLAMGAQGAFKVNEQPMMIIKGIKVMFDGEYWFPRLILSDYIETLQTEDKERERTDEFVEILSPREHEILKEVAAGKTNDQIAETLFISPNTVRNHLASIYRKMKVKNRLQAALWAKKYT